MFYGEGVIVNVSRCNGKRPFLRVEFESFKERDGDKLVAKPYRNFLMFFDDEATQKRIRDVIEDMKGVSAINFDTSEYQRGGEKVTSKIIKSFTERLSLDESVEFSKAADIKVEEELVDDKEPISNKTKDLEAAFDEHLLQCLKDSEKIVVQLEHSNDLNIKDSEPYWYLVAAVFEKRATPRYYFFNGYDI